MNFARVRIQDRLKVVLLSLSIIFILSGCSAAKTPTPTQVQEASSTATNAPATSTVTMTAENTAYPAPTAGQESSAYPAPQLSIYGQNEPYPSPAVPAASLPYPGPGTATANIADRFTIDLPVLEGTTVLTGTGRKGTPLEAVDISQNGVVIGSGVVGENNRFSITLASPIQAGRIIGIQLSIPRESSTWVELWELRGENARAIPGMGYYLDSVVTEPKS